MTTEDVLPKELDKLEITHILPQNKLWNRNLPVQWNPFFNSEIIYSGFANNLEKTISVEAEPSPTVNNVQTNVQNCRRSRSRRASESVLSEFKHTSTNNSLHYYECARSPLSGVIKPTLKKSTSYVGFSGHRKVVLREPVLKALHTCVPSYGSLRKKLSTGTKNKNSLFGSSTKGKGISDFRDLIDECCNLLYEDVDINCSLNQNCKHFTTMQTQKIPCNNKAFKHRRAVLNAFTIGLSSPEKNIFNADQHIVHSMTLIQSSILDSSTNQNQLNNVSTLSPDIISNISRCSATCSQQAGSHSSAAECDDVTIDELASYFDTFVHIPKKMSSMAEMMYI